MRAETEECALGSDDNAIDEAIRPPNGAFISVKVLARQVRISSSV
jgi:hypothetical protein